MHEMFLKKILEQPAEDLPRLIYADWLEEQGDPRAEFIRAQIQLEQLTPGTEAHQRTLARCQQLEFQHRPEWSRELYRRLVALGMPANGPVGWEFRRGFVEQVRLPGYRFDLVYPQLRQLAPVREVCLDCDSDQLPELVRSPHLENVQRLTLRWSTPLTLYQAELLADSPSIRRVEVLHLQVPAISEHATIALKWLTNLSPETAARLQRSQGDPAPPEPAAGPPQPLPAWTVSSVEYPCQDRRLGLSPGHLIRLGLGFGLILLLRAGLAWGFPGLEAGKTLDVMTSLAIIYWCVFYGQMNAYRW